MDKSLFFRSLPYQLSFLAFLTLSLSLGSGSKNTPQAPILPEFFAPHSSILLKIEWILAGIGSFFLLFLFTPQKRSLALKFPQTLPITLLDILGLFLCLISLSEAFRLFAFWGIVQYHWDYYASVWFANTFALSVVAFVGILMIPHVWGKSRADFGLRWCGWKSLLWTPCCTYFITLPFIFLLEYAINPQSQIPQELVRFFLLGKASWEMQLQTALVVPTMEEILFRGFLFQACAFFALRWSSVFSPKITQEAQEARQARFALFGSAFLFALAHGSLLLFTQIFILGIALGALRLSTQSLYPCIVFHLIHNSLMCLKLHYLSQFI